MKLPRRAVALGGAAAGGLGLLGCTSQSPTIDGGFVGASVERGHQMRKPAPAPAPAAVAERRTDVLIVGGGVAGLAVARRLHAQGKEAVLLELEASAGGNARGHLMAAGALSVPCPMGAHYLPVPSAKAPHGRALLQDLGLAHTPAGRWQLTARGQRHLCHSPQERLFYEGAWQEGLLPLEGVSPTTLAQYRRFAQLVAAAQATGAFTLPLALHARGLAVAAQREMAQGWASSFAQWLAANQLTDERLLWYLDYCCRDDYGAPPSAVSAWAGLHYFASRHGFSAPGEESPAGAEGVLTWPQGNGWLTERMAAPLQEASSAVQLATGWLAVALQDLGANPSTGGVRVTATNAKGQVATWHARRVVLATPMHVSARLLASAAPAPLAMHVKGGAHTSAWAVANVALREPLADREGAAPAWDSVIYSGNATRSVGAELGSLGYVDAMHQSTRTAPGPTVLSWYVALGAGRPAAQKLLDMPWAAWRDAALAELSGPHPDLPRKVQRIDVARYGHAMSVPSGAVMQSLATPAMAALRDQGMSPRIHFAHSDWAGYSVFEEAFTLGELVAARL